MRVLHSSESTEWHTPPKILYSVLELFDGVIDLDPCSNAKGTGANVPAKKHYTKEDDGLSREWHGKVYMNPPYGREIFPWIEKLREEYEAGSISQAVALVPSRTETAWFRLLSPRYLRCEVSTRLKFSDSKDGAPFPSTLFYLGTDVPRFVEVFGKHGVIVAPREVWV